MSRFQYLEMGRDWNLRNYHQMLVDFPLPENPIRGRSPWGKDLTDGIRCEINAFRKKYENLHNFCELDGAPSARWPKEEAILW